MPLSKEQKKILDKYGIPEALQYYLGNELGIEGVRNDGNAPDFLQVLSNHLQVAEISLHAGRNKLARLKEKSGLNPTEQEKGIIDIWEDELKNKWDMATGLWRACDTVVTTPDLYQVQLDPKHVEYALLTKNLPVIEMLKWKKPEFFDTGPISPLAKYLASVFGGITGAILGSIGGVWGGLNQISGIKVWYYKPFALIIYALRGVVTGSFIGMMLGARFGFQTGKFKIACKLAFNATQVDPFRASRGTKNYQAVELRKLRILFAEAQKNRHSEAVQGA